MEAGQCSLCHKTQAKFACSCVFPSIPMCEVCTITHLGTEGAHMPVPIKKAAAVVVVESEKEACDECRSRAAVRFCLCSTPVRKFCNECDSTHYQRAPLLTHSKHPITALLAVATGRVPIETFRKKQLYINDLQLRIGEELTNFDAFMRQIEEEFDAVLHKVTTKKEEMLRELQTQRAKLVEALNTAQQNIESKRYMEALEVTTELDWYLANGYQTLVEYSLQMFSGKLDLEGVEKLLAKAVVTTLKPNVLIEETRLIPVIKGDSLRLFHPVTFQMTQLTLNESTKTDLSTAYCYIRTGTVLCCGGGFAGSIHNEVYEVNVRNGRVEKAPNMNSTRCYVGIWCTPQYVFVFGGVNGSSRLNTAEKYNLERKSWTNLATLMPKSMYGVSVCEHSSRLYLSGSDCPSGTAIQYFDLKDESFWLLRFDTCFTGNSLMCCLGEELYHIKQGTIEVADLSRSQTDITFAVKAPFPPIGFGNYWLCCPMDFREGELVSVLHQMGTPNGLFSYLPAKNQFTKVVAFTY